MEDEYQAFLDKFKPKKTTDDCYTPENIYREVLRWACDRYGFQEKNVLRPFWPGADYQTIDYPSECVVVDNPPFSIFSKIMRWYAERGIRFFLFAPALTALGSVARINGCALLAAGSAVTYENGAVVNTSFVTNLDDPDVVARSVPDLDNQLKKCNRENTAKKKRQVTKLSFPDAVLTGAKMNYFSTYGIEHVIRRSESCFIRALDNYSEDIFGGGLLLSERAAAERAAAERIALSARELSLQKILSGV